MATSKLISVATGVTTGGVARAAAAGAAFQAIVSGTGTVTATLVIEASLDGNNWLTIGTISLSGTALASDGFAMIAPWEFIRPRLTAISGTGAAVDVYIGV